MSQYFKDIEEGIRTTITGLKLTFRHLLNARRSRKQVSVQAADYFTQKDGIVTLQYPFETIPVPDNGRYRLHNEIDDCIVCDKCAKVCPVDCITIDAVKATEEVGKASDGSPIRLYAAKFDIDMAKCCYCGLCTTVCPTECLTMTKTYDFSEFELGNMTYHFTNLTPEQAEEKRDLYEQFVREKEELKAQKAAKAAPAAEPGVATPAAEAPRKPVFRPGMKPAAKPAEPSEVSMEDKAQPATETAPTANEPGVDTPTANEPVAEPSGVEPPTAEMPAAEAPKKPAARPVFRPTQKPAGAKPAAEPEKPLTEQNSAGSVAEHPLTDATPDEAEKIAMEGLEKKPAAPKPAFRPTMKPPAPKPAEPPTPEAVKPEERKTEEPKPAEPAKRPAFRPTMKPNTPPKEES
ncbi:4Fe-4S dicluster domain-containing protein [Larkinella soli]|uniref:4Fe-4S dicluster domain-containing protein n=1 Tax=Larkinella soli TaxID=1770527 RepID=UPI000FFBC756|nr:4Fe-4S dicluster domain-containing protein [Larkinella soli]